MVGSLTSRYHMEPLHGLRDGYATHATKFVVGSAASSFYLNDDASLVMGHEWLDPFKMWGG